MRVLITGMSGFAGGHLAQELLNQADTVFGVARRHGHPLHYLNPPLTPLVADLCNEANVARILAEVQPEVIYHLAGQAFVPKAWEDPWHTMEQNIRPQLNILQAMVQQNLTARLLIITSNQVYGFISPEQLPVSEELPLEPNNPYGVSKATQDILALQYFLSHQIDVIRVRAFNHIGPRQSPAFVSASFARQIAAIEAGLSEPVIHVGNLDAERDFTDVRDVVRAYALLAQHGVSGEAYNVGTGQAHAIQHLLDILLNHTTAAIDVRRDPTRMRPADMPIIYADNRKLCTQTGWHPAYRFEDSVVQVLEYWRHQIHQDQLVPSSSTAH